MVLFLQIEIVWVSAHVHVLKAFLGKTKDNPYLSLLSLFGSRAEKDGVTLR